MLNNHFPSISHDKHSPVTINENQFSHNSYRSTDSQTFNEKDPLLIPTTMQNHDGVASISVETRTRQQRSVMYSQVESKTKSDNTQDKAGVVNSASLSTPADWHRSQSFTIPKNVGETCFIQAGGLDKYPPRLRLHQGKIPSGRSTVQMSETIQDQHQSERRQATVKVYKALIIVYKFSIVYVAFESLLKQT